jgi:alpha-tubulin suppressor-like RCC1 family protein
MLLTWGRGKHGVLGHGDDHDVPSPRRVLAVPPIAQIAAGELHCVALTSEGRVLAWGSGLLGALGHGTRATCHEPTEVVALRGEGGMVQVSAGRHHSLALSAAGEVLGWGACGGESSLLPRRKVELTGQGVMQIGCGDAYCAALTPQGASAWGAPPLAGTAALVVPCLEGRALACAPRRLLVLGAQGELRLSRLLDQSAAAQPATAPAAAPLLPPTPGERFCRLGAGARFCAALSTAGEVCAAPRR